MAGNLEFIKSASGTSVSSLDVTDCFSAKYDVYQILLSDLDFDGTGNKAIGMRFLDSVGTVITASEYDSAVLFLESSIAFSQSRYTNITSFGYGLGYTSSNDTGNIGCTVTIYNPYNSSSYTFFNQQSIGYTTSAIGTKEIGVHKSAEQITGVNIYVNGAGNFSRLTVKVFGVK